MSFLIEPCAYGEVAELRGPAAVDRVSLAPTQDTSWFRAIDHDRNLLGCAGLLSLSGGSVRRVKSVFVKKGHRGQGIGTALANELEAAALDAGAIAIQVLAYNPAFYQRRGYVLYGQPARSGARWLLKTL